MGHFKKPIIQVPVVVNSNTAQVLVVSEIPLTPPAFKIDEIDKLIEIDDSLLRWISVKRGQEKTRQAGAVAGPLTLNPDGLCIQRPDRPVHPDWFAVRCCYGRRSHDQHQDQHHDHQSPHTHPSTCFCSQRKRSPWEGGRSPQITPVARQLPRSAGGGRSPGLSDRATDRGQPRRAPARPVPELPPTAPWPAHTLRRSRQPPPGDEPSHQSAQASVLFRHGSAIATL